jgi:tetratricopeptide (TPR) repeat protein
MRAVCLLMVCTGAAIAGWIEEARAARDAQDKSRLQALAAQALAAAQGKTDARPHYEAALVHSYWAEVLAELRDNAASRQAAEAGFPAAERSVQLEPGSAEYHRLLGTLYGQVIPGNVASGVRYGRKTLDELNRAIALDPKSALAYVSRGIGKYYLPAMFGGGAEKALEDLRKALELDPASDQAHLWLGIALRKAGRNAEAREALAKAVQLNPRRAWAKQQLEKTPAP